MKTEFKGTKGKWELLSNETWCEIHTKSPLKSICAINRNLEGYEANALLVSKAPEMLEMLKKVLDNSDVPNEIFDEAKQLIKEATEL